MVKLIIEGGGDQKVLKNELREAFNKFLTKAGFDGKMPRIVAGGGRAQAYDLFRTEIEAGRSAVLLVDSERDVLPAHVDFPWTHLKSFEHWDWLPTLSEKHCHFMSQCMESWFLADKTSLEKYYGTKFKTSKLSDVANIESVSKDRVFSQLNEATRDCDDTRRNGYNKGRDSFKILMILDPTKVKDSSICAKRFLEQMKEIMDADR